MQLIWKFNFSNLNWYILCRIYLTRSRSVGSAAITGFPRKKKPATNHRILYFMTLMVCTSHEIART